MQNALKIQYANATLRQFAKAVTTYPGQRMQLIYGENPKEVIKNILDKDKFESYKSYDKKGGLTLVGKAKKLTDLANLKLSDTATIEQYFNKFVEYLQIQTAKIVKEIQQKNKKES